MSSNKKSIILNNESKSRYFIDGGGGEHKAVLLIDLQDSAGDIKGEVPAGQILYQQTNLYSLSVCIVGLIRMCLNGQLAIFSVFH